MPARSPGSPMSTATCGAACLNVKLRDRGASSWRGTVDIRKFSLVDEATAAVDRLDAGRRRRRSLNQAVKKDIDVSSARFERGFANLMLDNGGGSAVENGVVRGMTSVPPSRARSATATATWT